MTGLDLLIKLLFIIAIISLASCTQQKQKELNKSLSFGPCKVQYKYYSKGEVELYGGHSVTNDMEYASGNRKLAHCLCLEYLRNKDSNLGRKILEIYNQGYGNYWQGGNDSTGSYNNLDSLIKYRDAVFDSTILID